MTVTDLIAKAASLAGPPNEGGLRAAEQLTLDLIALLRTHGVADYERAASEILDVIGTHRGATAPQGVTSGGLAEVTDHGTAEEVPLQVTGGGSATIR